MNDIQLQLEQVGGAPREASSANRTERAGAASFARTLGEAVNAVDNLQLDADKQADAVAHGAGNLHEVAIALEKADVGMRLATRVRNKVIDTYNDIMRMSI